MDFYRSFSIMLAVPIVRPTGPRPPSSAPRQILASPRGRRKVFALKRPPLSRLASVQALAFLCLPATAVTVLAATPEIGAIFADGFEIGSIAAWH